MFGPAKARSARKLAAAMQWDLTKCHAYGDSFHDRWLLGVVGRATAVNADNGLRRIARNRSWTIVDWRKGKSARESRERIDTDAVHGERVESLG